MGNSGSRSRLKYGPQGNTVNVASRIEGMTREIGCPLVVSAATADRISGAMPVRKIGLAELKGIQQSIELCEVLTAESRTLSPEYLAAYEQAQTTFAADNFQQAIQLLTDLKAKRSEQDPVVDYLLAQAKVRPDGPASLRLCRLRELLRFRHCLIIEHSSPPPRLIPRWLAAFRT